ncbi:hypothetical protein [Endozoicomonas elysicola]|uniref:Uncharacterized protein n=1 Tax=Endozoicomonas elysicola TaxID=305900 RepID=A0A081KD43_9GAMM|nr:hypothetical protein [Endozoicomonas elysicola]KEI72069.1 hypothetical protein GV64_16240 [Endozoicomonas elysicola]
MANSTGFIKLNPADFPPLVSQDIPPGVNPFSAKDTSSWGKKVNPSESSSYLTRPEINHTQNRSYAAVFQDMPVKIKEGKSVIIQEKDWFSKKPKSPQDIIPTADIELPPTDIDYEKQVDKGVEILNRELQKNTDPISRFLKVERMCHHLRETQKFYRSDRLLIDGNPVGNHRDNKNYNYFRDKMTRLYETTIIPFLQRMKLEMSIGHEWQYHYPINDALRFLPLHRQSRNENSKICSLAREVARTYIERQVDFLKFRSELPCKDEADDNEFRDALMKAETVLAKNAPAVLYGLINPDEVEQRKQQIAGLKVDFYRADDIAREYKTESEQAILYRNLEKLALLIEKMAPTRSKHHMERIFAERFLSQIREAKEEIMKPYSSLAQVFNQTTALFEMLLRVNSQYNKQIKKYPLIKKDFFGLASGVAKKMMLSNYFKDPFPSKKQLMDSVNVLLTNRLLDPSCQELWDIHNEGKYGEAAGALPETALLPIDKPHILDISEKIERAGYWLEESRRTDISARQAAELLRPILAIEEQIREMKGGGPLCSDRFANAKSKIYMHFFQPVFDLIKVLAERQQGGFLSIYTHIIEKMAPHKNRILLASPHTDFLQNDKLRSQWQLTACKAWGCSLSRLNHRNVMEMGISIIDNDLEDLLDLQNAAPDVPCDKTRELLEQALITVFKITNSRSVSGWCSPEKLEKLSSWALQLFDKERLKTEREIGAAPYLIKQIEIWQKTFDGSRDRLKQTPSPTQESAKKCHQKQITKLRLEQQESNEHSSEQTSILPDGDIAKTCHDADLTNSSKSPTTPQAAAQLMQHFGNTQQHQLNGMLPLTDVNQRHNTVEPLVPLEKPTELSSPSAQTNPPTMTQSGVFHSTMFTSPPPRINAPLYREQFHFTSPYTGFTPPIPSYSSIAPGHTARYPSPIPSNPLIRAEQMSFQAQGVLPHSYQYQTQTDYQKMSSAFYQFEPEVRHSPPVTTRPPLNYHGMLNGNQFLAPPLKTNPPPPQRSQFFPPHPSFFARPVPHNQLQAALIPVQGYRFPAMYGAQTIEQQQMNFQAQQPLRHTNLQKVKYSVEASRSLDINSRYTPGIPFPLRPPQDLYTSPQGRHYLAHLPNSQQLIPLSIPTQLQSADPAILQVGSTLQSAHQQAATQHINDSSYAIATTQQPQLPNQGFFQHRVSFSQVQLVTEQFKDSFLGRNEQISQFTQSMQTVTHEMGNYFQSSNPLMPNQCISQVITIPSINTLYESLAPYCKDKEMESKLQKFIKLAFDNREKGEVSEIFDDLTSYQIRYGYFIYASNLINMRNWLFQMRETLGLPVNHDFQAIKVED